METMTRANGDKKYLRCLIIIENLPQINVEGNKKGFNIFIEAFLFSKTYGL